MDDALDDLEKDMKLYCKTWKTNNGNKTLGILVLVTEILKAVNNFNQNCMKDIFQTKMHSKVKPKDVAVRAVSFPGIFLYRSTKMVTQTLAPQKSLNNTFELEMDLDLGAVYVEIF